MVGNRSSAGAPHRRRKETIVISHTYSVAGSYTAVVTATNAVGSDSLSTPVEITAPPACWCPDRSSLAGLPEAYIDLTWFFTATLEPAGPTAPITYTWSPEPASGQGTGAAAYSWAATGTITLTVLAQNCGGEAAASLPSRSWPKSPPRRPRRDHHHHLHRSAGGDDDHHHPTRRHNGEHRPRLYAQPDAQPSDL